MPTIGVAISVPEPFGGQLRRHRADFGDPLAETVPSHVTLTPPMEVAEDHLPDVYAALEMAADEHEAYLMHLRGTGTFQPISPVVFIAVSQGISHTELLAKSVRNGLGAGEPVFPFHPHVTVAHHLHDAALDRAYAVLATFECAFLVDSFALYVHDDAAGWTTHCTFGLR